LRAGVEVEVSTGVVFALPSALSARMSSFDNTPAENGASWNCQTGTKVDANRSATSGSIIASAGVVAIVLGPSGILHSNDAK
jgi:hypothetical protein